MKSTILFLSVLFLTSVDALSQNVGIGTPSPIARLDVTGAGSTSSTNALVLKNSNGDTLLRMRNDGRMSIGYNGSVLGRPVQISGIGVNFYRTDEIFGGAIFPTDTSLVIWSELDNHVILQPTWGNVGIGTYAPKATLDVNGTVILGASGSVITQVLKVTVAKNLASVPASSATIETFTITGANIGSAVSISPNNVLPDGLLIAYARVSAANTVEVKFMNVTGVAINPATMNFYIAIVE
jgi:hypothetical protein